MQVVLEFSLDLLSPEDTQDALLKIHEMTDRPFGVNFVLHETDQAVFDVCLDARVPVFSFFRGQPTEATAKAHSVGAVVLHQVTTISEVQEACAAGVDVLVAQGREAGGHMGPHPLWTLLPEVIRVAGNRPTLAAGGIVDGQGLAAALCFGAAGALVGTRFLATPEAPVSPEHKQAIIDAEMGGTIASLVWDHLWGSPWPGGIKVRSLRNAMTERWAGREDELVTKLDMVRSEFADAENRRDIRMLPMLAGEGAARIREILPAAQIVRNMIREVEEILGLRTKPYSR